MPFDAYNAILHLSREELHAEKVVNCCAFWKDGLVQVLVKVYTTSNGLVHGRHRHVHVRIRRIRIKVMFLKSRWAKFWRDEPCENAQNQIPTEEHQQEDRGAATCKRLVAVVAFVGDTDRSTEEII